MLEQGGRGDHSWTEFIPILTSRAILNWGCCYGERVWDVSGNSIIIELAHKVEHRVVLSDNAAHISLTIVFEHFCHRQEALGEPSNIDIFRGRVLKHDGWDPIVIDSYAWLRNFEDRCWRIHLSEEVIIAIDWINQSQRKNWAQTYNNELSGWCKSDTLYHRDVLAWGREKVHPCHVGFVHSWISWYIACHVWICLLLIVVSLLSSYKECGLCWVHQKYVDAEMSSRSRSSP